MSDYIKQNGKYCSFNTSEIWVFADEIAIQIKKKIEEKGVPLEDWKININRGILTGYNEAFILNKETKDRLIKEDPKSAEIIRPILRGRDMTRYGYSFAQQWLIATFPSRKINIDNYPAIKSYLLNNFGIRRLEQSGKEYIDENGKKIKSRKLTNNKWFETQDSIAYWEDFFHPKIMCNFIADRVSFCYVPDEMFCVDPAFFVQNEKYNRYFLACLNTCLIDWYYRLICEQINGQNVLMLGTTIRKIPIPKIDDEKLKKINSYVDSIIGNDGNASQCEKELEHEISQLYGLSDEEERYINNLYFKKL